MLDAVSMLERRIRSLSETLEFYRSIVQFIRLDLFTMIEISYYFTT